MFKAVATALRVTPEQATRASRSMSPEQSSPLMAASGPPAAGWSPATRAWAAFTAAPDDSLQAIEVDERVPSDDNVTRADFGFFL